MGHSRRSPASIRNGVSAMQAAHAAFAARNLMKVVFRGGVPLHLFHPRFALGSFLTLLARKVGNPMAVIAAAGKTNAAIIR